MDKLKAKIGLGKHDKDTEHDKGTSSHHKGGIFGHHKKEQVHGQGSDIRTVSDDDDRTSRSARSTTDDREVATTSDRGSASYQKGDEVTRTYTRESVHGQGSSTDEVTEKLGDKDREYRRPESQSFGKAGNPSTESFGSSYGYDSKTGQLQASPMSSSMGASTAIGSSTESSDLVSNRSTGQRGSMDWPTSQFTQQAQANPSDFSTSPSGQGPEFSRGVNDSSKLRGASDWSQSQITQQPAMSSQQPMVSSGVFQQQPVMSSDVSQQQPMMSSDMSQQQPPSAQQTGGRKYDEQDVSSAKSTLAEIEKVTRETLADARKALESGQAKKY